jgi:hypothetical protein
MTRALTCLLLLLPCAAEPAQDRPDKKAAELKWAKEVVTDFMTAGLRGEHNQAVVLLSAELKKALESTSEPDRTFVYNRFGVYLNGAKAWSVSKEEIAPDMDEAVFRGTCTGDEGQAEFTVRVVKEKDTGKWRVHLFSVGRWKKPDAPPKKEPAP